MTDSTSPGYLLPTSQPPPRDAALDDVLQAFVSGVSGLPGKMVRPRWQPVMPSFPEPNEDWVAFGVLSIRRAQGTPTQDFDGTAGPGGNGVMSVRRWATLNCLASFYGPNAQEYATRLEDGAVLAQNRFTLQQNGLDVKRTSEVVALPDLVNSTWQRRYDLSIDLAIETTRDYAILSLLKQSGTIVSEGGDLSTFDTENY